MKHEELELLSDISPSILIKIPLILDECAKIPFVEKVKL